VEEAAVSAVPVAQSSPPSPSSENTYVTLSPVDPQTLEPQPSTSTGITRTPQSLEPQPSTGRTEPRVVPQWLSARRSSDPRRMAQPSTSSGITRVSLCSVCECKNVTLIFDILQIYKVLRLLQNGAARCVDCQVEVCRQSIREFRLNSFLQQWRGDRQQGPDELIDVLTAVQTARVELRDTLWLTNRLMEDTNVAQMIRIAPAIWEDVRMSLEAILVSTGERLRRAFRSDDDSDSDNDDESSTLFPTCRICLVNLPTVALLACGHVLCKSCSKKVIRCPFCRKAVLDRKYLFF